MRRPTKPWYREFNDTWYVQIDGEKIPLIRGKENEDEARRLFHQKMAERGSVTSILDRPRTILEISEAFLGHCQVHNTKETYEWRRYFLEDFTDRFGSLRPDDLTPTHFDSWFVAHQWSDSTKRSAIGTVKRVVHWAIANKYLTHNPLVGVVKPPQTRREVILEPGQHELILSKTRDEAYRQLCIAMLESGCRPGEVRKLEAKNVDLRRGIWTLKEHKTKRKTGKDRVIYLTPVLLEISRKLVEKYPTGPIFRNSLGRPWSGNAIRCRFRYRRKQLGLDGVVAYTYRHTYATEALVNGVDPLTLCELLGHTNPAQLMVTYQHLARKLDHMRNAARKARGYAEGDARPA